MAIFFPSSFTILHKRSKKAIQYYDVNLVPWINAGKVIENSTMVGKNSRIEIVAVKAQSRVERPEKQKIVEVRNEA